MIPFVSKTMNCKFAASVLVGILSFLAVTTLTSGQSDRFANSEGMKSVKHLNDFQVIEFRRSFR